MTTLPRIIRLALALLFSLGMNEASQLTAQTFTVLHAFESQSYDTNIAAAINSDGAWPDQGCLLLSGKTLYGTAPFAGRSAGTVFRVNSDGSGFAVVRSFEPLPDMVTQNSGGGRAMGGLTSSGNTLFGTASKGGINGNGTVFRISTDGSSFEVLHDFAASPFLSSTNMDGIWPMPGLIISGDALYGTAREGGVSGGGTIFGINSNGTGFQLIHTFNYPADGSWPCGSLILSSNMLYGTATYGGSGYGTLFKVGTDGNGFTILHTFTGGSDGGSPYAGLVMFGNTLYGTTSSGGGERAGTVFSLKIDGSAFLTLHNFSNRDGQAPRGNLLLCGSTLYGTTSAGGAFGSGTVFALSTNGAAFTILHSLTGGSEGSSPYAGLVMSGNTVYGTASGAGNGYSGTVFSLLVQPQLTIVSDGLNVVLTWPTNYSGYGLQSSTSLASPAWTSVAMPPVVVNGQNIVTNTISGTPQLFRLSQ